MRKALIFMREFALMTAKSLKWMIEFPPATVGGCVNGHGDGLMENWQAVRAGKSPRRLD